MKKRKQDKRKQECIVECLPDNILLRQLKTARRVIVQELRKVEREQRQENKREAL